jgi:hypothetical protein
MALIQAPVCFRPSQSAAASPQQCRVIITHHHSLVRSSLGQTERSQRAARAVAGLRIEETAVLDTPGRPQDLAARTAQQVVLGVVPETPQRHGAADRFGLGRDDGIDAAPFEIAVNLAVGVASICGDGLHFPAGGRGGGIDALDHHLAFVRSRRS